MPFLLGPDFRGPYFQGAKRLNLGSPNLRSRSIKALGRNKKTGGPWINDMTSIFERSKIPLKKNKRKKTKGMTGWKMGGRPMNVCGCILISKN